MPEFTVSLGFWPVCDRRETGQLRTIGLKRIPLDGSISPPVDAKAA
jgi:hypothetical protein